MSALRGKLPPVSTGRLAGGLLAASRPLPADYQEWRQGVSFTPHLSAGTTVLGCEDPEDASTKTIDAIEAPLNFDPFLIYQGRECSTWFDLEELRELARRGLAATESGTFALELQSSTLGNPDLVTSADVLAGGPADVVNAFSGLSSAACECGISDLTFHVNLRVIPFLMERHLVEWDATTGTWRHGPWTVSADCYSDEVVPTDEDALNVDGSETYIYVTGPIETSVGPEIDPMFVDAPTNVVVALVERLAMLRFDSTCVKAARTTLY